MPLMPLVGRIAPNIDPRILQPDPRARRFDRLRVDGHVTVYDAAVQQRIGTLGQAGLPALPVIAQQVQARRW
jgi:hypothetical protein